MKTILQLTGVILSGLVLCPATVVKAAGAPKKVLVVTVTTGFRHSCIPLSETVFEQLARESGQFQVDFVRQPAGMPKAPARPRPGAKGANDAGYQAALKKFEAEEKDYRGTWMPRIEAELRKLSPANLKNYDAVLFASTTGDLPLPDKQGFLEWIAAGHAFIGVHAATDTFHGFKPFVDMIGGEFLRHGQQVTVDCLNEDPAHAACQPLPGKWTVFDEIYQFQNYERSKVHGLLRLESLMLTAEDIKAGKATPGHYPVSWCKTFGRGRVFYTSLGHREDMWEPSYTEKGERKNPTENAQLFQRHVLGGLRWALGLAPGSAALPGK